MDRTDPCLQFSIGLSRHNRGLLQTIIVAETDHERASRSNEMISPQTALHDQVFRAYLLIVPGSLAFGGVILGFIHWD